MTFDQLFRILKARWKLAIAIAASIIVATLLVSLIYPKSYQATASLLIDAKPDPVSINAGLGASGGQSYLATQVDVIGSAAVAQRVARTLGMENNARMRELWQKETDGKGNMQSWLGDLISRGLKIKPSRESNVIDIIYQDADPAFAAIVANTFAKAYIDTTVDVRLAPARQYTQFFEERAALARQKLERAQEQLSKAQREKGILATEERLDVENARLNDLSSQVVALRGLRSETSSRDSQARSRPEQMEDVLDSGVIGSLKADLARQEARLEELSSRLGQAHPSYIEALAAANALKSKINIETSRRTASLGINNSMAGTREESAKQAYEEQRARLLKLKESRSELAVLERDVESAQRIYDTLQVRLNQANLESNSSQAGITLLTPATEPAKHSSPKMTLNMIAAIVLGSMLAIIVVLTIELMDRRVRGAQDITQLLNIPVIGILPMSDSSTPRLRSWHKKPPSGGNNALAVN
ncbi:MAG: chain length determinant protein EpsF [Leptothrix sp. (in: Bacteria)]|nr:chain length determinant protein EpsF [Leptothrix sp. (in: b-proteobacteria)]